LIDGDSTHNFIQAPVVHFLGLTSHVITPLTFMVGNCARLTCTNICTDVPVILQTHSFLVDLFVMDLAGSDLVLGVDWLKTLGPIITNYSHLTMRFMKNAKWVEIQGGSNLVPAEINNH